MPSRIHLLFAAPVLLSVALAGCGSSSNTAASAGGSSGAPTTTTAAAPVTTASGSGTSSATTVATASTGLGTVLVNSSGRTLYHFDKDSASTFGCNGSCLTAWPPLTAGSGAPVAGPGVTGTLAVRARPDGTRQVTWNGLPLYTFAGDQAAGDTKGDGIGGLWHVAKAGATTSSGSATTTAGYGGVNY